MSNEIPKTDTDAIRLGANLQTGYLPESPVVVDPIGCGQANHYMSVGVALPPEHEKTEYHLLCPKCGTTWWSEKGFPMKCPQCGHPRDMEWASSVPAQGILTPKKSEEKKVGSNKQAARRGTTMLRLASQRYTATVSNRQIIDEGSVCIGLNHFNTRHIEISEQEDPLKSIQLALHEVIHALEEQCTIELSHDETTRLAYALGSSLFENMPWWLKMGLAEAPGMQKRGVGK